MRQHNTQRRYCDDIVGRKSSQTPNNNSDNNEILCALFLLPTPEQHRTTTISKHSTTHHTFSLCSPTIASTTHRRRVETNQQPATVLVMGTNLIKLSSTSTSTPVRIVPVRHSTVCPPTYTTFPWPHLPWSLVYDVIEPQYRTYGH